MSFYLYENSIRDYVCSCSSIIEANSQLNVSATSSTSTTVSWLQLASKTTPQFLINEKETINTVQVIQRSNSIFSLFSSQPFPTATSSNSTENDYSSHKKPEKKRRSLDTEVSMLSITESQHQDVLDEDDCDNMNENNKSFETKKEEIQVIDFKKIESGIIYIMVLEEGLLADSCYTLFI